jgi:hypothetical protein
MKKYTADNILELLKVENHTALQLTEALGVNHSTTTRSLNTLRAKKRIYIYDWVRPIGRIGGNQEAVYRIGNRQDAPRPLKDRAAECRRHRIKWGRIKLLKRQAKRGTLTPFDQLLWAAR